MTFTRIRFLPLRPVLAIVGVLLLAACVWKAHALATQTIVLTPKFWSTRWFQTGLVEAELFLGLWLLSGLYSRRVWLATLACFAVFCLANFYLSCNGEKSCPCFGSLRGRPGPIALLDLALVLVLLLCKPFPEGTAFTLHSHPQRLRAFLIAFGVIGVPTMVLLGGRIDPTFTPALRHDRALKKRLAFEVNYPTNGELFAILHKNTGLNITADVALTEEQPSFGSAHFQNISASSLMEQMLGKQSVQTSWVKTDDGYRLVRAPLYQRWLHWLLAAALLALVAGTLWRLPRGPVDLSPKTAVMAGAV